MKEYRFESSSKHLYRWTETRYDERGNLISEAEVSCDGTAPTEAELTEKRITYTYDDEDRLSKVSYPEGFDGNVSALEYAYDNYGRLSEITVVTATGSAVLREYTYNVWGQIESIKDNRQALGGTGYTLKTYGYDKLDRNTAIVITDSEREGVAEQYTYGYNYEDQITEETRKNFYPADEENQVNETRHYGYDNLGRMTFGDGKQYTYDSVGNCLTVKNSQTGETETVNTYNSLNQLVASGDSTYTYDANGNQIRETKGSTVKDFTYDADNRLRMITCMENGAYIFRQDNGYNGLGQRTSKFVEAVGVSLYTAYDYQMGSVVHTSGYPSRNALNLLGDAGNIIASERPASDESGESGKEYYFYNKDIRSSTTSVLDSSGSCEVSYEYGDFGETTIHGNYQSCIKERKIGRILKFIILLRSDLLKHLTFQQTHFLQLHWIKKYIKKSQEDFGK